MNVYRRAVMYLITAVMLSALVHIPHKTASAQNNLRYLHILVDAAMQHLSAKVGTQQTRKITAWDYEGRLFTDTSLGCPAPGASYEKREAYGVIIKIYVPEQPNSTQKTKYEYRALDDATVLFECTAAGPGPNIPVTIPQSQPVQPTQGAAQPTRPPQPAATEDPCSKLMTPRLIKGQQGRVTPGDANLMRSEPSRDSDLVGKIPSGAVFKVLDGPRCGARWFWWQVEYEGLIGWTGEGENGVYWLEPLIIATPTPQASRVPTRDACPGFMRSRLKIGEKAQVTPGDNNVLRSEPNRSESSQRIGSIKPGEPFTVLAGPTCADNMAWWQVEYNGLTGWTPEGEKDTYWLEPLFDKGTVIQSFRADEGQDLIVSYQTISFVYPGQPDVKLKAELYSMPDVPVTEEGNRLISEILPAHLRFVISNELSNLTLGELRIFDAEKLEQHYSKLMLSLHEIQPLLETQGDIKTVNETIPLVNGKVVFRTRPEYIKFKNGTGFALITRHAEAVDPISDALYRFQGLTDDGKHFITGDFLLHAPLFDQNKVYPKDKTDQFDSYVADYVAKIEAASSSDFSPNLDTLHTLLSSLDVK